jgi:hypothetical protein
MLDFPPSGLRPPVWWGVSQTGGDPYEQRASDAASHFAASGSPGVVLSGAALAGTGLSAPVLDPEHSVLYLAKAIE